MNFLIKKILQEEVEMKEMGLKINKLKELQPSNYLVQSLKKTRSAKSIEEKSKFYSSEVNRLFVEFTERLKSLDWRELTLKRNANGHFYLFLPKYILDYVKLIVKYYDLIDFKFYYLINDIEKIYELKDDFRKKIKNNEINMYIEDYRNRTHFPEGLPKSLLGYNLGYKMYRKLLDDLKFIQSEENASKEVQAIYRKLLEQTDINVILSKNSILLLRRDLTKDEKLKIVSEFIFQYYKSNSHNRPCKLQKDIIFDGPLLRELNPNKMEELNRKIFNFSNDKQGQRLPYTLSPLKTEYTYGD